ncbi:hypothetical protein JCM8208_001314 [Rhodotorula glutinis]
MPASLLSLPDELLALIVDEAAGEYAPRLYKDRQRTCRALSLVNKRVGAIASGKLLEAVHAFPRTSLFHGRRLNPEQVPHASRVRALLLECFSCRGPTRDFLSFSAMRDLRLVRFENVLFEDLNKLPELRTLVLEHGTFPGGEPLIAPKLERLVLCCSHQGRAAGSAEPFTAAGCPSLRHLYLGRSNDGARPWPCAQDLIDQVDTLGLSFLHYATPSIDIDAFVTTGAPTLDKMLFNMNCSEFYEDELGQPEPRIRHLRVHADPGVCEVGWEDVAHGLLHFFPSLETLYLPLALDDSRVVLDEYLLDAVNMLVAECERARVAVVYEAAPGANGLGETYASQHFETRCRRIEAE